MKTAFITGISGQDGAYLAQLLLNKGYKVIGGDRRTASGSLWRLEKLGINGDVEVLDFELAEFTNIYRIIEKVKPDEIYNLAAQSFVGVSFDVPIMTSDITGISVCRILESIRNIDKAIKLYQASSSEMFGKVKETPQNENTNFYPRSPYGIAKLYAHWMTVNYRESYDMYCCSGILFNHESPLRGNEFITKKIINGIRDIKSGKINFIEVGNIYSRRDWGYAKEYVEAMWLMLQQNVPSDYVIATGKCYSVKEFIELAFKKCGISIQWRGEGIAEVGINEDNNKEVIRVNPKYYRPSEVDHLIGDCSKAREILGWTHKTELSSLINIMMSDIYNG